MTQYARLYGGSLYDLAAEENLTRRHRGADEDRSGIFSGEPRLSELCFLSHPFPKTERTKAHWRTLLAGQAERYLVNFT